MKAARELRSGKGHKDENFPVASFVIEERYRGLILAFYEFVRIADDISDHAALTPDERVEYEKAKRRGPRTLALIVIGRMDLIRDGNAVTPHSSRPGGHAPGSAPKGAGAAKEAPTLERGL